MAQPVGMVEAAASAAPRAITLRRERPCPVAAVIASSLDLLGDDIADRFGPGNFETLLDAGYPIGIGEAHLGVAGEAFQPTSPEGHGAPVVASTCAHGQGRRAKSQRAHAGTPQPPPRLRMKNSIFLRRPS